jgi:hypothetical protein
VYPQERVDMALSQRTRQKFFMTAVSCCSKELLHGFAFNC